MGCHSHKTNSHGLQVCVTEIQPDANNEKENCITCHMPEVEGSFSTIKHSAKHRFHGFSGAINKPKLLQKYILIALQQQNNGFDIVLTNKATHPLMLHPLRVASLQITLLRHHTEKQLPNTIFSRVIGTKGRPSAPWLATKVLHDTRLKAKELRVIHYNTQLQPEDAVIVTFGYYIVNPKMAKKLSLQKYAHFVALKQEVFHVK